MDIKLSAVIIAKNEEKMISDCLSSLKWADEILVVDTGSEDKTIKIAKKYGAKVVEFTTGKNFSDWRNKGAKEAKGDWILYVDADERILKDLKEEIKDIISKKEEAFFAFAIPRKNIILGREFRWGGFWPDYQKRLFKKENLSGWSGDVHEEPKFKGGLGHLKNPMLHIKHETFSEMIEKTNNWSEIEARLMFEAHHPPMNIMRFISALAREFWYRMIRKMAFLDGREGIAFAIYQVFSKFISYAKLWEMQIKK